MIKPRSPLLWMLLLGIAAAAVAAEPSADQRFLAGLRQRGLFRLAETYCLTRLQRPELTDRQRAELTIELSRCLAERAVASPPESRTPLWQRATRVIDDFVRQNPRHPRLLLVRLQGTLGVLARGELARQESQVAGQPGGLLEEAKTHLRTAIRELEALAEEVDRQQRSRLMPGRETPDDLSVDQLATLKKNIQYDLARALRNQAQCYPAGSPDRASSLTKAVKLLDPLAKLDPIDPLAYPSRLDQIVCYRLLADYPTAGRLLDALLVQKPPPWVELRGRAQSIHLALATGNLGQAMGVLEKGREIDGVTSPRLDYAWLETFLAAWRAADDAQDTAAATAWQDRSTEMVREIASLHGPYWTRRAEMLLARYVRAAPDSGNLAMLVQAAESSFRSGRLDDAVAAYDRAEALARQQGNAQRAFELGYIAATIEHSRDRHAEALDRYRRIATATPDHRKAAAAHELAIYHAGWLVQSQQGRLEDYAALLREHVRIWPGEPTADRVRRRLGHLCEYQRRWKEAVETYQQVSRNHAEFLRVVEAVERCYRAWLGELKAAGRPTVPVAAAGAEWFERLIYGPEGAWPERWSPVQRRAATAAARLRMNYTASGHGRVQSILSAALQDTAGAPPEWQSAARSLLAVALAKQEDYRRAGEQLQRASPLSPKDLRDLLRGLDRVAERATPEARARLAELRLQAIRPVLSADVPLAEADRKDLEATYARALAQAGRIEEALAAYERLAAARPDDGEIQESYARLLLSRTDEASLRKALTKWRELEKRSPEDSPRWYRAKYSVAWIHYELGNKQQAAKMIELLKLLHPELGGDEMARRFETLLQSCQR